MKEIGICTVTHNSKEKVLACLSSLFEQTPDLETVDIVVVDNNSLDGTVDEIRDQFPKVRLLVNDHNCGFSKAVNQGLRVLEARYFDLARLSIR